ncbi:hypothetical protein E2C01_092262 [Portunus trituberculatus]|uniref:Uncharacterized protein n=1 Tax=Portunus trituberculatus TaxID=210409 RepID=A0A5B7JV03_PORTR|nr:hypothetical protein [Portunus trituberculatus]
MRRVRGACPAPGGNPLMRQTGTHTPFRQQRKTSDVDGGTFQVPPLHHHPHHLPHHLPYHHHHHPDHPAITPQSLLNTLQRYQQQLAEQEKLSHQLHRLALDSSLHPATTRPHVLLNQLSTVRAIRTAIRAEVAHMEYLLSKAQPNSFTHTCLTEVVAKVSLRSVLYSETHLAINLFSTGIYFLP